jgi:hypothetical protein
MDKKSNPSFMSIHMDRESKLPAPDKYIKLSEWPKFLPPKHGKFGTKERRSIAGEIYHKAKRKETSSPGVTDYNPDAWKKNSDFKSQMGNYK